MRNMRNAPSRIKYHLRPMYDHLMEIGHVCARASRRSIHGIVLSILALSAGSAYAQGTPIPYTIPQYFDANGNPLASGGICTFEAGTTTLATVYTNSTLTVAHPNPVRFNAAGRPTVSGATLPIFLSPGRAYKFILKDATVTTCSPDTGVTLWSVDNIQAVPGSGSSLDATGTAGEAIAAGDVVYLSTGDGGTNPGQWYKTDSDNTNKSTSVFQIGIAPSSIAAAATGTIRLGGSVTVSGPLSTGSAYYVGATPGAMVTTPPTNAIRIGEADSATSIVVGYVDAPIGPRGPPCGRLTLTTGLPVTVADVTAATTVFYTPAGSCNTIDFYDGTQWKRYAFAEVSIAVPATTNTMYDVFAYDNAGVVTLELTAWTNDTTRATALVLQNGVYVKTGALTRRYLGSFRTTGVSGQTEDSFAKRLVWNYYNRAERELRVVEATNSWTYDGVYRQANGVATNQLAVVIGVAGAGLRVRVRGGANHDVGNTLARVSIGEDSTTTPVAGVIGMGVTVANVTAIAQGLDAEVLRYPAVGYHIYVWLESAAAATMTWYGDNGDATLFQAGIFGTIWG